MGAGAILGLYLAAGLFVAWSSKRVWERRNKDRYHWLAFNVIAFGWGLIIPIALVIYAARINRNEPKTEDTQEHPAFKKRRETLKQDREKEK